MNGICREEVIDNIRIEWNWEVESGGVYRFLNVMYVALNDKFAELRSWFSCHVCSDWDLIVSWKGFKDLMIDGCMEIDCPKSVYF